MIEVTNLHKKYGEVVALKSISFQIKKAEIVGFLGPNAAGKTTTLKIITCFLPPTSGKVTVGNFSIYENTLEVRKQIGYLPESNALYLEMSVFEYLDFIAKMRDIPNSIKKKRINDVIEVCGLKEVLGKDIGELSKGYKQRVGLAQAIIHDPPILLLDEPTSGLDPNQIIEIRNLIKTLGKEKTVVLSTHILSEVQATCDRVIIIHRGEIVADGKKDELQDMVAGKEKIYYKVKASPEKVTPLLEKLDGVEEIKFKDKEKDLICGYDITVAKGVDIRETLSKLAFENGWPLYELRREVVSLEEIFRMLTQESSSQETKQ